MNQHRNVDPTIREKIHRVLGYLNFSSGTEDAAMLRDLNELFRWSIDPNSPDLPYEVVLALLQEELQQASVSEKTFADATQATLVLQVTSQHVLPRYLLHHRDLLFHRTPETLFNSFFLGRVFEAVLRLAEYHDQPNELARRTVGKLNDFIGHRPVAVLETQKLEPYENEWVRPVPIYIRDAGVAVGPNSEVIQCAIRMLYETDPEILQVAQFDPNLLDELAIDPRSFDFDHPVNKRPNHHFGHWDEHHIDGEGRFRRFVIHQVTLDALTSRTNESEELPRDELILEAGAVLAGTILMAAGICGWGPGAHDSTVTLSRLLPGIAWYRDRFYADLLSHIEGTHHERLLEEVTTRQQPFGAARQHLNQQLARYRAFQMVHVHLALIFSRMGYETAAIRHVNVLPVASARMFCQIECQLYSGSKAIDKGDLALASDTLPGIFDMLKRAINCGAIIDPWNILGFDANYNLFQGNENTVRDHRADDLVELMEQIFCFASQVWIAAQAEDQTEISERVKSNFREIVDWWHKYAVHEVSSMESADCQEIFAATGDVANLLSQWQKDGARTGDVQFWANHARSFLSPRTYILAIHCLIERDDYVTSMALLIHWLTQSETIPLQQSSGSFQALVAEWVARQRMRLNENPSEEAYQATWNRIRKFCDYVEANAGDFWNVPVFNLKGSEPQSDDLDDPAGNLAAADDDEDLFRAAYEDMVFRESANDGFEGEIFDSSRHSEESIQAEMHRIAVRIEFLQALSEYWVEAAMFVNEQVSKAFASDGNDATDGEQENKAEIDPLDSDPVGYDLELLASQKQKLEGWAKQAECNCKDIEKLLRSVQGYPLPQPDGSMNSLAEYDRHRLFKEMLLDQGISLHVSTASTARVLAALTERLRQIYEPDGTAVATIDTDDAESQKWQFILASVLSGNGQAVIKQLPEVMEMLAEQPLLYVPLSKGGAPMQIVATRVRQCMIGQLLESLPKLGLFLETRELIHLALMMERKQSVRQGAVTEFDELFRIGYASMVESLIDAFENREAAQEDKGDKENDQEPEENNREAETISQDSEAEAPSDDRQKDPERSLFDSLEMLAESMLMLWLSHSQTLRLSVLEKVRDPDAYKNMVDFIDQFGEHIFTQQFLSLSNIRAILHQGVDAWLSSVETEENTDDLAWQVVEKIKSGYPRTDAVRHMTCVLETIIENFNEYRDYNCTTTQSDNGRQLYVLLDFLRLRCRYDQVCWNLKPVIWAHEILVRMGESDVAQLWRRLLADRVKVESEKLLEKLGKLQNKHSIQMATVSQRINERFVHPMQVDRLTSLVLQAMEDPSNEQSQAAFDMIETYAESLTQQPIGIGFELPGWISALQEEVELTANALSNPNEGNDNGLVHDVVITVEELCKQLRAMPRRD